MSAWLVIGEDPWAQALTRQLRAGGGEVQLWTEADSAQFAADLPLTRDLEGALARVERVIVALPPALFEPRVERLAPHLRGDHRICTSCRGLSPYSKLRATEVILQRTVVRQVAVLAGAAEAETLEGCHPAALVIGTPFSSWAQELQGALASANLRIYTNPDMAGVELANALSAVVGVALTAARALKMGGATEATALTRAVAEVDRVTQALGGRANTAFGLAGLGVLSTFLFEERGLIFEAGQALASKQPLDPVAFGALGEAAQVLSGAAEAAGVRAPMLTAVAALFAGRIDAEQALGALMRRSHRAE